MKQGWFAFLFFLSLLASSVHAQSLLTEQVRVEVPVVRENVAAARDEALNQGKQQLTLRGLQSLISPTHQSTLLPILQQEALKAEASVLESFRVISEQRAADLSRFSLVLEGRLFRSRLIALLRDRGLPLSTDNRVPKRLPLALQLPSALSGDRQVQQLTQMLAKYLEPYQVQLGQAARVRSLQGLDSALLLNLDAPSNWDGKQAKEVTVQWGLVAQGNLRAQSRFQKTLAPGQEQWTRDLGDALLLEWGPVLQAVFAQDTQGAVTEIQITGVPGPLEEALVLRVAFSGKPQWNDLSLSRLLPEGALYQGELRGNQEAEVRALTSQLQPLGLQEAGWIGQRLRLRFDWQTPLLELEPFAPDLILQRLLKEAEWDPEQFPEWQIPARGGGLTRLPEEGRMSGTILNRGDSDLLQIPAGFSGTIRWQRLGPTNLMPQVSLYDANLQLLERHRLGKKTALELDRTGAGEDAGSFFIRVSDEIGYIEGVVGGYQLFHYILELRPQ